MTVNERWRICFEFRKRDAYDVEIVDTIEDEDRASRRPSGPCAKA